MERNTFDQEKREARRKRRIRSQIAAYSVLLVLLALVASGLVLGIDFISRYAASHDQEALPETTQVLPPTQESTVPPPTPSSEQETSTEPPEPTPQEQLDEMINSMIAQMSIEDRVAGLFFVKPEAITNVSRVVRASDGTRTALEQYPVGGLIYNKQNMNSAEQFMEMLQNTKEFAIYPLFYGIDEEGGTVSRLQSSGIAQGVDGAAQIGATQDANNAYLAGVTTGSNLAGLGLNLDFAPVADVANIENSIMESRSYGTSAQAVIPFVNAMMLGLQEQGITACLKHFPGIGATTDDTHEGISISQRTAEEFRAEEFQVFSAGIEAGAQMIMVGHIAAPSLTGDNTPSCLSEAVVTDILRHEMNFDGVIITDALDMEAIHGYYTSADAAVRALRAGCDMLLMPKDFYEAYQAVLQAVAEGIISEERINDSLRRIYRIKYANLMTVTE
ncbi:MAG: glycoside hydrolase family 3 protein [Lachnospiraceae bacterium]|jgi:beta-N-acetylhexosaminidase|nr:glycoside hydrolase family 3 protein [Lachnospiraceae bacterium]